jgi:hypothetical protein
VTPRPVLASDGLCIDTSTKLTASECKALKAAGVGTVWRYVFFSVPRPGDIDEGERDLILAAGLTLCLVQHVRMPGWVANKSTGLNDGLVAIRNAQLAGYQGAGLSLALDMEGVGTGDANAHAEAWCEVVSQNGYAPVVYVGYDSQLTGAQLDALTGDPVFWCDAAPFSARPAPARGYSLHQKPQGVLAGVGVDENTVIHDGALTGLSGGPATFDTEPPAPDPHADPSGTNT